MGPRLMCPPPVISATLISLLLLSAIDYPFLILQNPF